MKLTTKIHLFFVHLIVQACFCEIEARVPGRDPKKKEFCEVPQASYGTKLDFRKLQNETETIEIDSYQLQIRLCDSLEHRCNDQDGFSLCLTDSNRKQIGIGMYPPRIKEMENSLTFQFQGERCNVSHNYTTNIKMVCEYDVGRLEITEIFPDQGRRRQCEFNFQWRTEAACVPGKTIDSCKFADNDNNHYDLHSLINKKDNYLVPIERSNATIVFNVCSTLIFGRHSLCHTGTASCLVFSNGPSKNIGKIDNFRSFKPEFDQIGLKITYKGGYPCKGSHAITTIRFLCDPHETPGLPKFVGDIEKCNFTIEWKTSAACSLNMSKQHTDKPTTSPDTGNCTIRNPVNKDIYDLRYLRQENNIIVYSKNRKTRYSLTACGSVPSFCGETSGVCDLENKTNFGNANSVLLWDKAGPFLNYTDGDVCPSSGQKRYTLIEFSCRHESKEPIVAEENECYLVFYWYLKSVCYSKYQCDLNNGVVSFPNSMSHHIIKQSKEEYFVSLCGASTPKVNSNCGHGVGICKVTYSDNRPRYISLGYPHTNPKIFEGSREALFSYRDGAICSENVHKNISSNISVICDVHYLAKEEFLLKSYNNCTYDFEWRSAAFCGKTYGNIIEKTCLVTNDLGDKFNISDINNNNKNTADRNVSLIICGKRSTCNVSMFCDEYLARFYERDVIFDYVRGKIELRLMNTTFCQKVQNETMISDCEELYTSLQPRPLTTEAIIQSTTAEMNFSAPKNHTKKGIGLTFTLAMVISITICMITCILHRRKIYALLRVNNQRQSPQLNRKYASFSNPALVMDDS